MHICMTGESYLLECIEELHLDLTSFLVWEKLQTCVQMGNFCVESWTSNIDSYSYQSLNPLPS